MRQNEVGLVC